MTLMVTMRNDRIGSPCSSHGNHGSVNSTRTNAFSDKPGNQLRGPAPQVSMKSASLRLMGMFITSFQCRPSLGTMPHDGREFSAPNFSWGGRDKTGPCVQCSDYWGGCLRDWLLSCSLGVVIGAGMCPRCLGSLKTRRSWTSGCCFQGPVV